MIDPIHPRRASRRWDATLALVAAVLMAAAWAIAAAAAPRATASPSARTGDFAARVDIGGGRRIFLECRGRGAPTVILVSGLDVAADLWNLPGQRGPKVFPTLARTTRVCAYDRPGAPRAVGGPSRSDPTPQPTSPRKSVADLHALLVAAGVPGPYVLAGHSYGGAVSRLYAATYPKEVAGLIFVDAFPGDLYRDVLTRREWRIWKVLNARSPKDIADYPPLERINFDQAANQLAVAGPIPQVPLVVLTADERSGPVFRSRAAKGELPKGVPADFGDVLDRARARSNIALARLVRGAKHVTATHSGHNIPIDNAPVVIDGINDVVRAVRAGRSSAVG